MSNTEPKGPYVYQPFGRHEKGIGPSGLEERGDRIYGIGGIPMARIDGITKKQAQQILTLLTWPKETIDDIPKAVRERMERDRLAAKEKSDG